MSEWANRARLLRFGERRKVAHCTKDPSAYISNSPKGVYLHCFRCGGTDFEPHGRLSAADILRYREADDSAANLTTAPVTVPLQDAPPQAQIWPLKAFITPERATEQYGFGWDERTQRVVVPVLQNGVDTGVWTARSVDGRTPKYLMPKGSAGSVWFHSVPGKPLVLCEDVLSAIRIYEAGYGAAAILGTSAGVPQLQRLAPMVESEGVRRPLLALFDNDAAGRKAWVQLRKSCGVLGLTPERVQSDKDPKAYSRKQIQEILKC